MAKRNHILVIDVGNTSTSLGLYDGRRVGTLQRIEKRRLTTKGVATLLNDVYGGQPVTGVGIASVAPSVNRIWARATKSVFGIDPVFVTHELDLGIPVTYPRPETIGADRLANAAGAVARYGAPVIVGDFGTAVTFDIVNRRDGYIGGVIAPGPPLMFDYLAERTELLPRVSWQPLRGRIGKSTAEAMQLGAHWGYRGLFKEILRELKAEPSLRRSRVIATGGYAPRVLKGLSPRPTVDPTLTLFGIGIIHQRNA